MECNGILGERIRALSTELATHDGWSRGQLLEHQRRSLGDMLRYAVASAPFHRERLARLVERGSALEELPVMTKVDLLTHFDRIVTNPRLTLRLLEAHVAGTDPAGTIHGKYHVAATGGTTGARAVIAYDEQAWISGIASSIRSMSYGGLPPGSRVIGIGASSPVHLSNRIYEALRHFRSPAPNLSVSSPLHEVVSSLNDYKPDAVITYPSYLRLLAHEQLSGRLQIAPKAIFTVAETLCDELRNLANEVWGIHISNRYNSTETFASGAECEHGCGIHLPEDLVIYESVDSTNQPVPDGAPGSKLLITTLANRVLPLIRYEMTDIVSITRVPCICGRPYARLTAIQGRREEIVQLRSTDGTEHHLHAGVLRSPLIRIQGLKQFQFSAGPDGLMVRFTVQDCLEPAPILEDIQASLARCLAQQNIFGVPLMYQNVDCIARGGTGEKERLVAQDIPTADP